MVALREAPFPATEFVLALTSTVVPMTMSRTNTSAALLVSPITRSPAVLSKTAYRPLVDKSTGRESPFPPLIPVRLTLTSFVVPSTRSRRYTLRLGGISKGMGRPFVVCTRLLAALENSTNRPSGVITGDQESPPPPAGG